MTGAKGGTGASTIAHNIAFPIARDLNIQTVIADMDLGFGTVGLDFNQDPAQGVAEAVFAPDRIDQNLVDRLLSKCGERLSILAAPAVLDRTYDFPETAFDSLLDILRATTPCVILDIPHNWTAWARRLLINADEIAIVASPDLANLRNTKNLLDMLRNARAHDGHPKLIMNGVGIPKRPEISVSDFTKAVDLEAAAIIPFEPKLFGTAANNGQMVDEVEAGGKIAGTIKDLARKITHRNEPRRAKRNLLAPLMMRFGRKPSSRVEPRASRYSRAGHDPKKSATFLDHAPERFPIRWNYLIEKELLRFKELEHVLIEKVDQLFRNMLSCMIRESGNWFFEKIMRKTKTLERGPIQSERIMLSAAFSRPRMHGRSSMAQWTGRGMGSGEGFLCSASVPSPNLATRARPRPPALPRRQGPPVSRPFRTPIR